MFGGSHLGSQCLRVFVVITATASERFTHSVDGNLRGAIGILIRIQENKLALVFGVNAGALRKSSLASDCYASSDNTESTA
jgi:hypothetical protein